MLLRSALELIAVMDLIAILAVVSLLLGEPDALQALTGQSVRTRSPRPRPDRSPMDF